MREAIELLRADAEENDQPLRFYSVTPEIRRQLDELYPGQFEYEDCRYAYDYVYESSDLISLSGRKYHGKRNHISRFDQDNPNWTYEDIDHHNLCDCWDMFEEWLQEDKKGSSSYDDEMLALRDTLDYFDELGMQGGLLRVDGKVIAFTIGEPLTDDCFDLHFEKPFPPSRERIPKSTRCSPKSACPGTGTSTGRRTWASKGSDGQSFPTSQPFWWKNLMPCGRTRNENAD